MMLSIRQIYDAIGFLPKAKQNELRKQQKKIVIPFQQGLHDLINSLAYLQRITTKRGEYLNCATAGPEGTVYHISLDGFAETVKALETHMQVFETIGMADTINGINLYALLNESIQKNMALQSTNSRGSTDTLPRSSMSKARGSMKLKQSTKHVNAHIHITLTHLVLTGQHMPPTWLHQ